MLQAEARRASGQRDFIGEGHQRRDQIKRSDVDRGLAPISHQVLTGSPCGLGSLGETRVSDTAMPDPDPQLTRTTSVRRRSGRTC